MIKEYNDTSENIPYARPKSSNLVTVNGVYNASPYPSQATHTDVSLK